jgi:hypothetical protein
MKLWDSLAAAHPSIQTASARQANQWVDSLLDGRDKSRWQSLKDKLPPGTTTESCRFSVRMHYFDIRDEVCDLLEPKDGEFTSPEVEEEVKGIAEVLESSMRVKVGGEDRAGVEVKAKAVYWELKNYFNVGALLTTPFDKLTDPIEVLRVTLKAVGVPLKAPASSASGANEAATSVENRPFQSDELIYNHFRKFGPEFQFRTPEMFDAHFSKGLPAQIIAAKGGAMAEVHGDKWTGLSPEQQLAVAAYSGAAYKLMNPVLRGQVTPKTQNQAHKEYTLGPHVGRWVKSADDWNTKLKLALDKLRSGGGETLYRGRAMWVCEPAVDVDSEQFNEKQGDARKLLELDKAFLSTTRDQSVAYEFIDDNVSYTEPDESGTNPAKSEHVGIFATIEGGAPGADIAPLSAYPTEVETLLMPNLKFNVKEGPTLVKAKELEGFDRKSKYLPVFKAKLEYAPPST